MRKPYCSCDGSGTYIHRRCAERTCDHLNYPTKVKTSVVKGAYGSEQVKNKVKLAKVMDCPVRTCVCASK